MLLPKGAQLAAEAPLDPDARHPALVMGVMGGEPDRPLADRPLL
jgi:hypothetical protein